MPPHNRPMAETPDTVTKPSENAAPSSPTSPRPKPEPQKLPIPDHARRIPPDINPAQLQRIREASSAAGNMWKYMATIIGTKTIEL